MNRRMTSWKRASFNFWTGGAWSRVWKFSYKFGQSVFFLNSCYLNCVFPFKPTAIYYFQHVLCRYEGPIKEVVCVFSVGVMIKALCYYPDGPGINSPWCHWIFQWSMASYRTLALGPIKPLVKNEYQEHFLGIKAASGWGWRPYNLHVPNVMKIWESKLLGTLWVTPGLLRDEFHFYLSMIIII